MAVDLFWLYSLIFESEMVMLGSILIFVTMAKQDIKRWRSKRSVLRAIVASVVMLLSTLVISMIVFVSGSEQVLILFLPVDILLFIVSVILGVVSVYRL